MKRDDFDPTEHDPEESTEIDITLNVEMYEFEGGDGWVECRYYVVRNNFNDHYEVFMDAADLSRGQWINYACEIKERIKSLTNP